MPEFKERPKLDKPKAKHPGAVHPKQAARMMKERYRRELTERREDADSETTYAVEQVEGAGRWVADEAVSRAPHLRREHQNPPMEWPHAKAEPEPAGGVSQETDQASGPGGSGCPQGDTKAASKDRWEGVAISKERTAPAAKERQTITQTAAQPGDMALYPDASHIGMVVGRNAVGKLLICRCSSGSNCVVVTEFAASGFTSIGRPSIYSP